MPKISRFDIHDELTAPEGSATILKGALSGSGKLNNFVGVLAGSPAALRAYARMRSEPPRGALPLQNQGRVPIHLHEEAREQGWTDEQILEALAHVALADFAALISLGGEIPLEGTAPQVKPISEAA